MLEAEGERESSSVGDESLLMATSRRVDGGGMERSVQVESV